MHFGLRDPQYSMPFLALSAMDCEPPRLRVKSRHFACAARDSKQDLAWKALWGRIPLLCYGCRPQVLFSPSPKRDILPVHEILSGDLQGSGQQTGKGKTWRS